jgi:hypothetical protein
VREGNSGTATPEQGRSPRRLFALVAVFAVTLAIIPALAEAGGSLYRRKADAPGFPAALLPTTGAFFGTWVRERSGETSKTAIARVETGVQRTFAVDHQYYQWTRAIPTEYEAWTVAQGRIPFLNWKMPSPWSSVANGSKDAWIRERAAAFKAFGSPVYLTLHHEPEDDYAFGSESDYRTAFRHVVDIFREQGVTNVAFVWTMMAWTFDLRSNPKTPDPWYPGDDYVDFVGSDGFNWAPTKTNAKWESFWTVYKDTNAWAIAHGKPWIAVEYGVQEDPTTPGRKAAWYTDALATIKTWPALKAVIYFDETKLHSTPSPNTPYPWITDSSTSSMASYRAMGADPYLNPSDEPPTEPPPDDPPGDPGPADTVRNTFDGGIQGAPVGTGNSLIGGTPFDLVFSAGNVDAITFDGSRSNLGSAARIAVGSKRAASFGWGAGFRWGSRWFGRLDVWLPETPADRLRLVHADRGKARRMAVWLRADGRLAFEDARGKTVGIMNASLPTRTWVKIEWGIDVGARTVEMRAAPIPGNNNSVGRLQLSRVVLRSAPDRIQMGRVRKTASAFTFWTDNPSLSRLGYPSQVK